MNTNDLRVIKTKRNIEESVFRIMNYKKFELITINDILEEALINRTTFYKHYADKYALVESLCLSYFNFFKEQVDLRLKNSQTEIAIDYVDHLYHFFFEKRDRFMCLLNIKTEKIHLYDDMVLYLKERMIMQYQNETFDKMQLDFLGTMYASIVMSSLLWSLNNENIDLSHHLFPAYQSCISLLQKYLLNHQ